jgi:hypothetical protein
VSEQPGPTFAAISQDIRDARGDTPLMYELIREAKRLARLGVFDDAGRVPDCPDR